MIEISPSTFEHLVTVTCLLLLSVLGYVYVEHTWLGEPQGRVGEAGDGDLENHVNSR